MILMTISSCDNLIMTLSYHHILSQDWITQTGWQGYIHQKKISFVWSTLWCRRRKTLSFAIVGTVLQKELFQAKLPLRKITSKKRDIDVDRLEVSWIRVRFEFFSPVISNQGIPCLERPFLGGEGGWQMRQWRYPFYAFTQFWSEDSIGY